MKKRIGVVAGDINGGIAFQRGHLPLRHLRHKYEFVGFNLDEMNHSDAFYLDALIFIHPWAPIAAQQIHRARFHYHLPVIVDLDDLLTDLPSDHPECSHFKANQVYEILMLASKVAVSTPYLRKRWGHLNKDMRVIENSIEPRRYDHLKDGPNHVAAKPYHSGFVVGWTGGQSHRSDILFTGYAEGLAQLMDKYEDVRAYFHILCPQTLLNRFGARVIYNEAPVDYMDYPSMCFTYPFDLCAVPLIDHPFNHAKSDLRLLDMAPFHIPVMASPRASFLAHQEREILLFAEDGKWFEALEKAYLNQKELKAMAARANDYVMQQRVAQVPAAQWDQLLQECFPSSPPTQG